jgi:hypothetical protein
MMEKRQYFLTSSTKFVGSQVAAFACDINPSPALVFHSGGDSLIAEREAKWPRPAMQPSGRRSAPQPRHIAVLDQYHEPQVHKHDFLCSTRQRNSGSAGRHLSRSHFAPGSYFVYHTCITTLHLFHCFIAIFAGGGHWALAESHNPSFL